MLFPFLCPIHSTLPQAIFFPEISFFWELKSTLSSREIAHLHGLGFGDRVAPQEKRKSSFFLAREKG